jgi:HK97 gp10 family phage protein
MGYKSYVPQVKTRIEDANSDILRLIRGLAEGDIKKLATVDTGRLRDSITGDNDSETAVIGTNVEYAPFQELGTRYMEGKHFMENGATQNAGAYPRIAREVYSKL